MSIYNILIVDDDPGVITSHKVTLKRSDYNLIVAANRTEAWEVLSQFKLIRGDNPVDKKDVLALAILDQNLEDHDPKLFKREDAERGGLLLIQEVKALFRPTRTVVLTAYKGTPNDEGFLAGRLVADRYLEKTKFFGDRLIDLVESELQLFEEALHHYNSKRQGR